MNVIRHSHDSTDAFRVRFRLKLMAEAADESRQRYDSVLDRYANIGRIHTPVILYLVFHIAFYFAVSPHDNALLC